MRSFGGSSRGIIGGGSGGASGGGGSMQMLRSVQRAVRAASTVGGGGGAGGAAATHESFSHTHPSTTSSTRRARQTTYNNNNKNQPITLSSSSAAIFSPYCNLLPTTISTTAPPALPSSCSSPTFTDESDWECVDDCHDDFVFGTVPSNDEVHQAVFALQEVLDPASPKYLIDDRPAYNLDMEIGDQVSSPTGSLHRSSQFVNLDWMEPSLHLCNQSMLQAQERVYDVFDWLRNEPSVQRMVISLSSDEAVWDAVLNNEVVQELRKSLNQADKSPLEKSDDGSDASDPARDFLIRIIINTKAKFMELIDKIAKLVNEFFHSEEGQKTADRKSDPFEEKLRASFLLSVVVMLIVVVTRSSKA